MTAKSENTTKNMTIRLQPDIWAQVDRLAKANQRSRNFIINAAVGRYVAEILLANPSPAAKKNNMGRGAHLSMRGVCGKGCEG